MNVNLQTTRQWYESHGMLSEFYKKYKCVKCKYYESCMSMKDDALRIDCKEFEYKIHREPAVWSEMSYHKYSNKRGF